MRLSVTICDLPGADCRKEMSSQVSEGPTNSVMGPDPEACPPWAPRSIEKKKWVGLLPVAGAQQFTGSGASGEGRRTKDGRRHLREREGHHHHRGWTVLRQQRRRWVSPPAFHVLICLAPHGPQRAGGGGSNLNEERTSHTFDPGLPWGSQGLWALGPRCPFLVTAGAEPVGALPFPGPGL